MSTLRMPSRVYSRSGQHTVFKQLAVKIEMDAVSDEQYFAWLDRMTDELPALVEGAQITEKNGARSSPPLNIAVYYDTPDYLILPTGALLRTSCNVITHAFCAFKMAQDSGGVREDHRYVFDDKEKSTIQRAPWSPEAVAVVKRLLRRRDIEHPGIFLERDLGIPAVSLEPAICLEDYRTTFFAWLDGRDALRCSIDRFEVFDLRLAPGERVKRPISEVELAVYPRIDPDVASDPRVVHMIEVLAHSLREDYDVRVTFDIKYQRSARALGLYP